MRGTRGGFNLLLECVLGLGLFSACLLLLFSLFPSAANTTAHAQEMEDALQVAHQVMELTRASAYDDIDNVGPTNVTRTSTIRGVPSAQVYTYSVDVSDVSNNNAKRVLVKVDWQTGDINRHFELETCVAPY